MKQTILLSIIFIFLFTSIYGQEDKIELIKEKNAIINIDDSPIVHPSKISRAVYFDSYGPLRDLPKVDASYYLESKGEVPWNKLKDDEAEGADYSNWTYEGPDPVWQKEQGNKINSKGIGVNFPGQLSPYMPSDCNGTIGPNHFMQTVNTTYEIYNRAGVSQAGPTDMNLLFAGVTGASNNDGDPLILWDEQAQKWLAVEFSISGSPDYMLIAVSQTADPTGSWWRWSFVMNGMPDYEKIGIWEDGYYMSTNTYTGDDVYVFERQDMIIGGSSPQMVQFENPNRPNPSGFHCIMPFDNDGAFAPSGTPGQYITINDNAWGGNDELWVFECDVDWVSPGSSTFQRTQQISVSSFDSQFNAWGTGDIEQIGESQLVDANPYVLQIRAQYKNWGSSQSIVCAHVVDVDATNHAGIRWYELENTGSGWSIKQEGTYAPDAHSRWEVSIAMNDYGQIGMGYNISSSAMSPEIRFCGQSSCAPNGIMDIAETVVPTSLTPESQPTYNRWGDYSLITVDPADNLTFWYSTEYYASSRKRTQIISFTLDEACAPPVIATTNPTSLYKDRGKEITLTGTDFLGCSANMGGISGTTISNDGSTWIIYFPPGNYSDGNLVVSNAVGSDNTLITINTRATIPVDLSTGVNTDIHQTIDAAVDGLHAWYGTTAFDAGDLPGIKTIEVTSGTYSESITLNSELNPTASNPLVIQPASGNFVVVDATSNNYGFDLNTVDYVQLFGFEVHAADMANIYLQGDFCDVSYNKIYNGINADGIKIETGTANNIYNNLIYNNERYAVHVVNSNSNNIENNTTYSNGGSYSPPQDVVLFFDDFELDPATDWTQGTGWGWYTGIPYSGESMSGHTNATSSMQKTSSIDISAYTNIEIECYARSYSSESGNPTIESDDYLEGEYSLDGGAWTQFFYVADDHTTYSRYGTSTPITGSYTTIDIRFTSKVNFREYWLLEDVKVIADDATPAANLGSELYIESGTGTTVENNIFYVKNGTEYYSVKTEPGIIISSDYNTYFANGNTNLFNYNGIIDNSGPMQSNDLTSDPDFVVPGTDFHLKSTFDSYAGGEWPPLTATLGIWTTDGSDSPGIDAGNPLDTYTNEPTNNGGRINQGAYGNTIQASKSTGIIPDITWTGTVSSDWQNTGNWDMVSIPLSTENVLIPNGCPNYPNINNGIAAIAVCNTVTIESSANLTIDPDGYMTVSGSIFNNAGTSALLINSDATGSGSLIQNTSGGVDATVQLYFDASPEQYHMISSPINNAPLTVFPTTNNLNYYDETTDDYWTGPAYDAGSFSGWTLPVGNLENTRGYLWYYYQTTLNFTGQLNDHTTSSAIPVSYTDHGDFAPNLSSYDEFDGWNLIGNPYTSTIDWDHAGVGHAAANLLDAIYIYDDVNHTYASYAGGIGTNGGTQYIPAGQGFYVKGDPTETSGILDIPSAALVHNDQAYWKTLNETPENFIRLQITGNGFSDETVVRFSENASNEPDNGWDAFKLFTWDENVPQLFTNSTDSRDYSINTFAEINEGCFIVPLKAIQTVGQYSITVSEFNFTAVKVFLNDKLNNEIIELSLNDVIDLVADESDASDRFELIFEKAESSVSQASVTSTVLYPNPNTGTFYLTVGNKATHFTVEITDVTGKIFYKNTYENNYTKEINLNDQSAGVYFVKIIFSDNSAVNKKIIVR